MDDIRNYKWHTLVEGQVYLSQINGYITHELMYQFDQDCIAKFDASHSPLVHIIHDTRSIMSFPPLSDVRKIKYPFHPRMGYNVTAGAFSNPMMGFVVGISAAIFRNRYQDVATLGEAYAYLVAKDPSLPPLNMWNLPTDTDSIAS